MAGLPLRDRFYTPKTARAITSPSGILLAGGVAAGAIVAGVPLVAALPLGAVAWAGKVWFTALRRRSERIDPFRVQEPWRRFVQEALQARNRFEETVHHMAPGPLRDSMQATAERIRTGVEESWLIAQRGWTLAQGRQRIDVREIDRQIAELEQGGPLDPSLERVAESLRAQRAAVARIDRVIADTQSQLRVLDARMDEAVARAVELSTQSSATTSAGTLGTDVDDLVTEMEALRLALEETHGTASGGLAAGSGGP